MKVRVFFSLILITIAIVLVFLPPNEGKRDQPKPYQQLEMYGDENLKISIDQAAKYVTITIQPFNLLICDPGRNFQLSTFRVLLIFLMSSCLIRTGRGI